MSDKTNQQDGDNHEPLVLENCRSHVGRYDAGSRRQKGMEPYEAPSRRQLLYRRVGQSQKWNVDVRVQPADQTESRAVRSVCSYR